MTRLEGWSTGHPVDLAAFRIAVCSVVLCSVDVWTASNWAPNESAARVATAVLLTSTLATLVGLMTRVSSVIAALTAVWLLGLPQQSGQVMHTHHLVWFLAIIAAAPSGDALSIDRWRAARRGSVAPGPSLAHGVPLRIAWASVGFIFFFPGVWKALSGNAWLDGLPALIAWKWFQLGDLPRVTLPAGALWWGGLATIAFELSFIALIISSRTRVAGAALAFLFHQGIWLTMGIVFSSLWACYVMFLPWARWFRVELPGAVTPKRMVIPSLVLGAALLGAQVVLGALGREDTWPVATYPTFRYPAPAIISWLEVEEVDLASTRLTFGKARLTGGKNQRLWGLMTTCLRSPTLELLQVFYGQWRGAIPAGVTEVRYFLVRKRLGDTSEEERRLIATDTRRDSRP